MIDNDYDVIDQIDEKWRIVFVFHNESFYPTSISYTPTLRRKNNYTFLSNDLKPIQVTKDELRIILYGIVKKSDYRLYLI